MLGFGKQRADRSQARKRRQALQVEGLEKREVFTAGITLDGLTLVVTATNSGDVAHVTLNNHGTPNDITDDSFHVELLRGDTGQTVKKDFNRESYKVIDGKLLKTADITLFKFVGGSGADKAWNNSDLPSLMFGYGGNDELHGGTSQDQIQGGKGSDKIYGGEGTDNLFGNGPSQGGLDPYSIDYIYGEGAGDSLTGGYNQTSYLFGGAGPDQLNGGAHSLNFLYGAEDNDTLTGGPDGSTNFLYGGDGNDTMTGGSSQFGVTPCLNIMIDDSGHDHFIGGDRASNLMYAHDGGAVGQDDVIVLGVINSYDNWSSDANDIIWQKSMGPIPK